MEASPPTHLRDRGREESSESSPGAHQGMLGR